MKKFLVILMVVAMAAFLFVGCEPKPATYTLTMAVNPTGGGTTTPAVGAHPLQTDGTVVPIAATPATGYKFVNWTGDVADLNSASTTVTMDADKIVTANFELELIPEVTYDLTMQVSPTGGGTTTPAVGTHNYASGAVVNISATPASGYEFVDWTGHVADLNSAYTTVTMNADKTVTANFELISIPEVTYDLTMQVSPTGGGTTTPAVGTYNYASGAVVNISATPASGYKFVDWTGDVASANSASTTVTMDADKTVRANFEELPTTAPIITEVPEADDDDYVNKAEAANGIIVRGTGDTDAEIYLYFVDPVEDKFAGTGDVTATGEWTIRIAKDDLGEDGDKILYATAEQKTRWVESPHSNEIEFTLDTDVPGIDSVRARAGLPAAVVYVVTGAGSTDPFAGGSPFVGLPAAVVAGTWTIDVNAASGVANNVSIINNATGAINWYTITDVVDDVFDTLGAPLQLSPIPGVSFTLNGALAGTEHADITCTAQIVGIVSLAFDEDLSYTGAVTNGVYVIVNQSLGVDILVGRITTFWTYNENTDTMFWREVTVGEPFVVINAGNDLLQGDFLTFHVDSATDLAGNPIPVGTPAIDTTVVLASTVTIAP